MHNSEAGVIEPELNKITKTFSLDHPTAAGHFPGHPIIPGALLLSEVVYTIATSLTLPLSACRIKSAKFYHPLAPGVEVVIEFSETPSGLINFQCIAQEKKVLAGTVEYF